MRGGRSSLGTDGSDGSTPAGVYRVAAARYRRHGVGTFVIIWFRKGSSMVNTRSVLLWLHIVVALVTMGHFLLFDLLAPGLVRAGNAPVLRVLERTAKVLGPMTLLIPLAGIGLVLDNDGYHFSQGWIIGALVGYVVLVVIGIGVLGTTMARAAERIEAGQDASAEATRLRVFGVVNAVIILTIVWLMVAKPGIT